MYNDGLAKDHEGHLLTTEEEILRGRNEVLEALLEKLCRALENEPGISRNSPAHYEIMLTAGKLRWTEGIVFAADEKRTIARLVLCESCRELVGLDNE